MEEGRIIDYISIKRPILVLPGDVDVETGDKGSMRMTVHLQREMFIDEESGRVKYGTFRVHKTEILNAKKKS
jgi:hypothetical protein